jgi:hypothetical protein
MALQYSVTLRNNQLGQIESTGGTSAVLKMFSGSVPANCAAADANGTPIAVISLPSDWMNAPSSGSVTMAGTWQDASADNTGTLTHFRIYNGATCHIQGTIGLSGTDMTVDNTSVNAGQSITINTFTINAGNA